MTNNIMNDNPSPLESAVMRRVYAAHAVRPLLSGAMLALALASLSLWGIGREVWVAQVFSNAPSFADFSATAHFWLAAVANTRLIVQTLLALALAATVYLARESARLIAPALAGARA